MAIDLCFSLKSEIVGQMYSKIHISSTFAMLFRHYVSCYSFVLFLANNYNNAYVCSLSIYIYIYAHMHPEKMVLTSMCVAVQIYTYFFFICLIFGVLL